MAKRLVISLVCCILFVGFDLRFSDSACTSGNVRQIQLIKSTGEMTKSVTLSSPNPAEQGSSWICSLCSPLQTEVCLGKNCKQGAKKFLDSIQTKELPNRCTELSCSRQHWITDILMKHAQCLILNSPN